MAITYDPDDGRYLDEADVRSELTRVFDICDGCRLCVELCTVFPTLFEMMDRNGDHDAGRLTPAQQDQVVDECVQCKRCFDHCPYTPDLHEWKVDVPRTMLRAEAMQYGAGIVSLRAKARLQITGRADLFGTIATSMSSLANRLSGAQPPFARQRFSTWFAKRRVAAPLSSSTTRRASGDAVSDLRRRVPGHRGRPRPRRAVRRRRGGVLAERRRLLRRTVAARRRRRALHQGRQEEREDAGGRDSSRRRCRRAAIGVPPRPGERTIPTTSRGPMPNSSRRTPSMPPTG